MEHATITIRPFLTEDEEQTIALWHKCSLVVPWNDPNTDIERKMAYQPDLFLVAVQEGWIVGTVMAGYDGHRGWLFYLASDRLGAGKLLVDEAERRLLKLGCQKINLQVRTTNKQMIRYYQKLGYRIDDVVGMGKRLQ